MSIFNAISLFLATFAFVGCAVTPSLIEITYESSPRGAYFESRGAEHGQLPQTFTYVPTEEFKNGGCMIVNPVHMITWKSGSKVIPGGANVCRSNGYFFKSIIPRPSENPNLEIDMLAQSEVIYRETEKALRRQKADQETIRQLQYLSNMNKPKATCTSTPMAGGSYSTTCY